MSMNGNVAIVKVKNEKDPDDICTFNKAELQLKKTKSTEKIVVTLPPDDEIVLEFDLNDCSYMEDSSERGVVECIRINSEEQTVIIIDKKRECEELLEYMRNYLKARERSSPSPAKKHQPEYDREQREREKREREEREREKREREKREQEKREREEREREKREREKREREEREREEREREKRKREEQETESISNKKVNELIKALNDSNADDAAKIARELARDRPLIRFSLDMINESGNAAPRLPPKPVVEPMKLKLSIESFLIESCTGDQYDVAILPGTTIKDLKDLVHQNAQIEPNQQYWYINRDLLGDTYAFGGTQTPRVNDKTVLILYIAKPQNN